MARLVICTGIPFPSRKDPVMKEKLDYHNKHFSDKKISKGDDWYETLAFRAINQALGRCIRHRNDWGSIVLLDERFYKEKYLKQLPKWFQKFIQGANSFDSAEKSLADFMEVRKAKSASVFDLLPASEASSMIMENSENILPSSPAVPVPPDAQDESLKLWKCVECSHLLVSSTVCKLFSKSMLTFDNSEVFGVGPTKEFVEAQIEECLQTAEVHDQMCSIYSCKNCNETIGFSYFEQLTLLADKTFFVVAQ